MSECKLRYRNRSAVIQVEGWFMGKPCLLEVRRGEMRSGKTGRWITEWCAKRKGDLAWDVSYGPSPRGALVSAARLDEGKRPRWLADAVREVSARLTREAT